MTPIESVKELTYDAPYGDFTLRVDDRARIKIPTNWMQYFTRTMRDNQVFVTSLDGRSLRIYSESIWRYNLKLMNDHPEQAAAINRFQRRAGKYGITTQPDPSGRVTPNQALRDAIKLPGEELVGTCENGVLCLYTPADYEAFDIDNNTETATAQKQLAEIGVL